MGNTANSRGSCERRRSGRIDAIGTAILHGSGALHGQIVDVAIGGLSMLVEGGASHLDVGDRVRASVRFDDVGLWFDVDGAVARIDACGLTAVLGLELYGVPQDFEDLVQNGLLSDLESGCENQRADTEIAPRADDLRCYLRENYPGVPVVSDEIGARA